MFCRRLFLTVFLLVCVACPAAAQTTEIQKAPIQYTSPSSGKDMFMSYCAVCHGKDAKGNGPAAKALKVVPADLTTLTKRNNGKFPAARISATILGQGDMPSHGTREMPVWGPLFRSLDPNGDLIVKQRVVSLTDYIKSLQEK
jgi:mono/diheme cytochrome c family protein